MNTTALTFYPLGEIRLEFYVRYDIFENGKLIGQDYQRDNGEWSHKWIDSKTGDFERGSWRLRCDGENKENWVYVEVEQNITSPNKKLMQ